MSIPIVQVLVTLVEPSGAAVVGASVTAKLSGAILYEGVVAPINEAGTTDQNSKCTLQLCPTNLGPTAQTYTFEIWPAGAQSANYFRNITVPNIASTTLEALLGFVPGNLTV